MAGLNVGQALACPSRSGKRDRLKPVLHFFVAALFATSAFAWGGAPDWLKQIARAPLPTYPADTRGVALLDETVTTVSASGEVRTLHRRAYKILSTAGRDLAYVAVHFDSETKLTAFRAWAFTAKGEEYQVKERDAVEAAAFDGELYADNRMKVLRIPAAEPGNVVGFEFEQLERPYGLQDVWRFQDDIPVLRARYAVSLPEGWKHEERWFNAAANDPQGSGNQLAWELHDVAALKDEPGMPALAAIAGRMAINFIPPADALQGKTHRTWSDVARWYAGLVGARRMASPQLQAKAQELVATQSAPLDRIRALTTFAQRDVRYVAIEIGIGGFQPHLATEIFKNRYGDCKDKVTVLGTMLREIGVESFYVLINTERGTVDRDFASHSVFNHAIIAIRLPKEVPSKGMPATIEHAKLGRLLLFDPTSENTPLGVLPPYLQ
ncbi:MAG TPA: DUF3857 and transglutaminase domain-containing protein, partial [Thermoanaerobaculia bacterium]|nr:DUF3857 and transglutaminase domain-containing protein [Thermoanaerobaculia bacterium]